MDKLICKKCGGELRTMTTKELAKHFVESQKAIGIEISQEMAELAFVAVMSKPLVCTNCSAKYPAYSTVAEQIYSEEALISDLHSICESDPIFQWVQLDGKWTIVERLDDENFLIFGDYETQHVDLYPDIVWGEVIKRSCQQEAKDGEK